jgi:hypothetical protein
MPEVIPDSRELVRTLLSTLESFEIVDLSHALEEGMPAWPSHARFGQTLYESYELGDIACHYGLTMSEHPGPTWTLRSISSPKAPLTTA